MHVPSDAIAAADPALGCRHCWATSAHSMVFDNSKLRAVVPEYVATITLEQAAREIVGWHDEDPARQQVDATLDAVMDKLVGQFQVRKVASSFGLAVRDPSLRTRPQLGSVQAVSGSVATHKATDEDLADDSNSLTQCRGHSSAVRQRDPVVDASRRRRPPRSAS